ncbi:MAG: hypothetical protein JW772_03715 [Candidatus Diapherotrites archaeon]|nr:hypothetical protein [Candidatus Diapherotrites archaeon]
MKAKIFFPILILAIFLAGCTDTPNGNGNGEVCEQVLTYGVDAMGNCLEFPTSCMPEGFTKVDSCQDLCEGVVCPDKCMDTTLLGNGECIQGDCLYEPIKENAVECGYKAFDLETETILRYCNYSPHFKKFTFFLSVKNLGETSPQPGGSVWLVSPNLEGRKIYQPINTTYGKNIWWWQEVFTDNPFRGQVFEVINTPEFVDMHYKFIYCELENNNYQFCTEDKGLVLYSGNTSSDCNVTN